MEKLFAIVDIETTGGLAKHERITEIGIVVHDGHKIIDTFQSLINPERSIPYNITRITGITDDMVKNAPKFHEIARKILEMFKDAIFVAHNVRFDYGFIREEFLSLGYTFTKKQLCTVKLSRSAFPGLPSYSLGNLVKHFGIEVNALHRAFEDAMATAVIFSKIYQAGLVNEIEKEINLGLRESKLPQGIRMEDIHALPKSCGVYYFLDELGNTVYIGKAINIQKRIIEHFSDQTEKARKLHFHTRSFNYTICGSELLALLLESIEIKKIQPLINIAQRTKLHPFSVYTSYHQSGMPYLKTSKCIELDSVNVIKSFAKVHAAAKFTDTNIEKFGLCQCIQKYGQVLPACIKGQIDLCDWHKTPIDEAQYIQSFSILEESFTPKNTLNNGIFVDKGRDSSENTLFLIKKGIVCGYGFVDKSISFQNIEQLLNEIQYVTPHFELDHIFLQYHKKHKQRLMQISLE